ncbi:MAG: M48 family metalloprotease [Acidobacteria bacterium]|nr:M48 family metalloprotease [Acidobacteriota bacterium]
MKSLLRRALIVFLCEVMISLPLGDAAALPSNTADTAKLREYLQKPYVELFEIAPTLKFSAAEMDRQRKALEEGKKSCVANFKQHSKQYGKEIDQAQKELKDRTATLSDAQRKQSHCRIQNLQALKSEADVLAGHAIPTAYDNLAAKLEVIEKWPALYRQTREEISSGVYSKRRWGDVKDIGFREIASGQEDDIKRGQEAIEQMKRQGMMPPELQDKAIQDYVNTIAQQIARHSDLKVPLRITLLQSKEINAFALPGGYLFIERGLLEAADDESQLAGVLAHEMAHVTARHSNKLMKRATIASVFYQAAQIAAVVLTGGVAGIGLYYALQYGFYGLGLVLDLKLLGVSREYELEADQLGIQYAWNAGYDPSGFTRFFDKIAMREGYVNGVSWFRTHPPFYQRMVDAQREILFLPQKQDLVMQSSDFEKMKRALKPISEEAKKEEPNKPTLMKREEGCEPPPKLEYEPGQPIEKLCSSGARPASVDRR